MNVCIELRLFDVFGPVAFIHELDLDMAVLLYSTD